MTAIKEEILNKEEVAIYIMNRLKEDYKEVFLLRYKMEAKEDIVEQLDEIGKKIGAFRNGEIDYEKVYTIILKDLREGSFGGITFDKFEDK